MATTDVPTGTVTFLFTDIEGSTRLWDQHPDAMASALSTHDDLLQSAIDSNAGYVFSKAGDGWGVAFESPLPALDTALTIQDSIGSQEWPGGIARIAVRMGLHTGTSAERNGDYFGTTVNRAARVAGVADGGQVFVTDAVHALVADEVNEDWLFRDLGEHRLRDLTRAERIWQLDHNTAPSPLATLAPMATVGNIPRIRATVVGRDSEIDAVIESLLRAPLVTLVGVGGVGKTTIARSVGARLSDSFHAGAWFVDLTATNEPDLIAAAVATSLGVIERPQMTTKESLYDALRSEQRLVILDNAEHQIDAVADLVDEILVAAPDVKLIVTSRESLSVPSEEVHRVGPLDVNDPAGTAPAVSLFIERARAVAPDLGTDAFEVTTVEAICRKLDGLPLAIELAASQSETMTPAEILAALESDSLSLQSSSRSTVQRHRSLTEMVNWSYELLDSIDRTVFERLSVFSSGCTMDAALFVCSRGDVTDSNVRTAIATLVRKSIVQPQRSDGTTRLTMLETLRHFSATKLSEGTDHTETAERHAQWFGEFSSQARKDVMGPDEARTLTATLADLDNIQAATRWASEEQRFDLMLGLGEGITFLMESKARPGMGKWIKEILDTLPADAPARLNFAFALGHSKLFTGDIAGAPDRFSDETVHLENRARVDAMHRYLSHVSRFFLGDLEWVIADSEDAMESMAAHDLIRERSAIGTDYALSLFYSGDKEAAKRIADHLVTTANESGNPTLLAWAMYVQGEITGESDPISAIEMLEEAVESAITVDNEFIAGISLIALSSTAGRNGHMDTAFDSMYRCIRLWRARRNRPQMWTAIRNLVEMLHLLGHDTDALALNAAVEADADRAPKLFGPFGDHYRSILANVEAALEPGEASEAKRAGSSLDYAAAATFALDALGRASTKASPFK
jgi:predicted ATPase/class 3 adenylate cyclase